MARHIALADGQNICFNTKNDGENVNNTRIDSYFRAHERQSLKITEKRASLTY